MATRRTRHAQSLATRTAELAFAAPQVVAQRLARMATAGPNPSARDRKEFHAMGMEKAVAFTQSWQAMALETFVANQALSASLFRSFWSPWPGSLGSAKAARQWQGAALGVLDKGLAPVHRKATANAKRLARGR